MNPAQGCLIGEPKTCDKHVVASIETPSDAGSIPATSIIWVKLLTLTLTLKEFIYGTLKKRPTRGRWSP